MFAYCSHNAIFLWPETKSNKNFYQQFLVSENKIFAHNVAGFSGYPPDNYQIFGQSAAFENLGLASGCVGSGIFVYIGVGRSLAAMARQPPSPFHLG